MKLTTADKRIVLKHFDEYMNSHKDLTVQDYQYTHLWATGMTMREIAEDLNVSVGTVSNVVKKMANRIIESCE